jgi:seryl-tRNA synthetase
LTPGLAGVAGVAGRPHGQVVLSGPALRLFDGLDQAFVRLGARWGCEPASFPPFLEARQLDRIGYFRSFPHHATFPVSAPADGDALEAFAMAPLQSDGAVALQSGARTTEVLTPAACYHLYVQLDGAALDATGYFTTASTCYRRESRYEPLVRQWAFTMRELVCVGSEEDVDRFLAAAAAGLTSLYAALGLAVDWLPAADPFFGGRDNPRYLMQRLTAAKQEAVFDAGGGATVALASVNRHGQLFGEAFGISHRGANAWSGCVGIGLERALFAVARAHGPDPRAWPDPAAATSWLAAPGRSPRARG